MEVKKRLTGITFARAFCAIGIIIFHFFCHSNSTIKFLFTIKGCSWGDILVTVFFVISGAVLYYNYENVENIKSYFYKRWKTIYLPFYICYFVFFVEKVILSKKIFWGGNPIRLVLSLIGLDGYLSYRLPNYYLVGEWFLGAIILIYLLYPLIVIVQNKNIFIFPVILITGYIIQYATDIFVISNFWNLFTCLGSFYFGILFIKYKAKFFETIKSSIIALILFLFVLFLNFNVTLKAQILGILLFVFLVAFGELLLKNNVINKIISFISSISFYIFLLQHQVILHILKIYNPSKFLIVLPLLFSTIMLTILGANIIRFVINYIYKSKCFKFLDAKFLAKEKE